MTSPSSNPSSNPPTVTVDGRCDDCDSQLIYIKFCPYCGVHLPAPEFQE